MPLLSETELAAYPEPSSMQVVGGYVRRYWDMVALADQKPVKVIGETGIIRDRPGFEVELLTRKSANTAKHEQSCVLMPIKGHWRIEWDSGATTLAPGDTMSMPKAVGYNAAPSMTGEAALYRIIGTEDSAGPTWNWNGAPA